MVFIEGTGTPENRAYLFKSITYHAKVWENVEVGQQTTVHLVDYDDVNPSWIGTTHAINSSGFQLLAGDYVLMTVTDSCEHHIIAYDLSENGTVTVPPPDTTTTVPGGETPKTCEGSCRWIWSEYERIWVLDEAGSIPCTNAGDTTTSSTSTSTSTTPSGTTSTGGTTTTPAPTTTTYPCIEPVTGDCLATCTYIEGTLFWQVDGDCPPGYECDDALHNTLCYTEGETQTVQCVESPATTTTGETTTTTPEPKCVYECITGGMQYIWEQTSEDCPEGYQCPSTPTAGAPCETLGEILSLECVSKADCDCLPPEYCGDADGECVYTYCDTYVDLVDTLDCNTTTSTTSNTTSTEPPVNCCVGGMLVPPPVTREDCCALGGTIDHTCGETTTTSDTTTTVSPDCTICQWVWVVGPFGIWGWENIFNGCLLEECTCYPPPPLECDICDCPCEIVVTPCIIPSTPTPCSPIYNCNGNCDFWWSCITKSWYYVTGYCFWTEDCGGQNPPGTVCSCNPPSGDGPENSNAVCDYWL